MPSPPDNAKLLDGWLALTGSPDLFTDPVRLPMFTGSMAPRIPIGCELVIAPADRRPWGRGDVVVFLRDELLIAHRVLLILGRGPGSWLLEKGDRNVGAGWIRRREVRGLVVDRIVTDTERRNLPLHQRGALRESVIYSLRAVARRVLGRDD